MLESVSAITFTSITSIDRTTKSAPRAGHHSTIHQTVTAVLNNSPPA